MLDRPRLALALVSAMLAACAACAACAARATARGAARPLRVASDLDNPPFAWVELDGQPGGRDVDMMTELAVLLGRPLEWQRMAFAELLPAVERGAVDVACATLGVTPERAERVRFTRPYFETRLAVVVRAGSGEPEELADLEGRRVGGGAGTTAERAILRELPRARGVFESESERPALERLLAADVDALVMDAPAAEALVAASTGRLRVLAADLGPERYALALPMDSAALERQLSRALDVLERRGRLAELDREHGLASAPEAP
jgi:polar amino acid transport system substrate-binding protein